MEKPVKIISDELITQINDQLKETVNKAVDVAISNIDWSTEIDIHNLISDELQHMDIMEHIDMSELDGKISDALEDILPQLSISKGY